MNLLNRIVRLFGRSGVPRATGSLRNKRDGMAWIASLGNNNGDDVLTGRAVKTVSFDGRYWVIEPPQTYRSTRVSHFLHSGMTIRAGATVTISGVADEFLIPWKEDGITKEEVRELYESQKQGKQVHLALPNGPQGPVQAPQETA